MIKIQKRNIEVYSTAPNLHLPFEYDLDEFSLLFKNEVAILYTMESLLMPALKLL